MATPLPFAIGDNYLVSNPVDDWRAEFVDTKPPGVVLTASIQFPPSPPAFPIPVPWATTLAVQMDARVAIDLYERLGALIQKMGWPTSTKDLGQS
jgi:hypothetical protein